LLACFGEFQVFGGVDANTKPPGDYSTPFKYPDTSKDDTLEQGFEKFKQAQQGFYYFVVNPKLAAVGATPLFAKQGSKIPTSAEVFGDYNPFSQDAGKQAEAMTIFTEVGTAFNAWWAQHAGNPAGATDFCDLVKRVAGHCLEEEPDDETASAHDGLVKACTLVVL
jgi:hypothetical protein